MIDNLDPDFEHSVSFHGYVQKIMKLKFLVLVFCGVILVSVGLSTLEMLQKQGFQTPFFLGRFSQNAF